MIPLGDLQPLDFPLIFETVKTKPDVVRRLILGFRDQYAFVIYDLRNDLLAGKLEQAGWLAHSLRTVAGMLGAGRVAEATSRLEAFLQPGQSHLASDALVELEEAILPLLNTALKLNRRQGIPSRPIPRHPTLEQDLILIIDDEQSMRKLLGDILQDEYKILVTADARAGLRMAEEQRPDLILLDVDLPDIDGYRVLASLKETEATAVIPVVFVTGSTDIESETQGLRLGAVDYIAKPVNPAILIARVGTQIKVKRAEAEARRRAEREHYLEMVTEFERSAFLEQTRQRQLKIKNDFLSHVSHELRSPAASIQSLVSLVRDGLAGEVTTQQVDYLNIALRDVAHLQAMIEDLLEATQLGSSKLSVQLSDISVSEATRYALKTVSPLAKRKHIQLSTHCPSNLPSCRCDLTRLGQILTILLDNSVKFTPAGGSVTVAARIFDQDASALLIEVADTGCGISPDQVASVFDCLYQCTSDQEQSSGLGLGLHIARQLVLQLGGKIWVDSVIGVGSTFRFTLPISASKCEESQPFLTAGRRELEEFAEFEGMEAE